MKKIFQSQKNITNEYEAVQMSFRVEEKCVLKNIDKNKFKFILFEIGGKIIFPQREIMSLYFDTNSTKMFHDSEEGITPRKKIRVRTYPNEKKITYNLEKKINSAEGRYKISEKIDIEEYNKLLMHGIIDKEYGFCYPQLWVKYSREYFSLKDQRITLDTNIVYQSFKSKTKQKDLDTNIFEIKANVNFDKNLFDNILPFSRSRFSKYSEGIKAIEESKNTHLTPYH